MTKRGFKGTFTMIQHDARLMLGSPFHLIDQVQDATPEETPLIISPCHSFPQMM